MKSYMNIDGKETEVKLTIKSNEHNELVVTLTDTYKNRQIVILYWEHDAVVACLQTLSNNEHIKVTHLTPSPRFKVVNGPLVEMEFCVEKTEMRPIYEVGHGSKSIYLGYDSGYDASLFRFGPFNIYVKELFNSKNTFVGLKAYIAQNKALVEIA